MTANPPPRRVITGIDGAGRSCVLFDGPAAHVVWGTDSSPADNTATHDTGGQPFSFAIPAGGTRVTWHDFPAGSSAPMHATDTIDYVVVVSGAISFLTETGETRLHPGDILVDRGTMHGWRNDGDVACRIVLVHAVAHPVGAGATLR